MEPIPLNLLSLDRTAAIDALLEIAVQTWDPRYHGDAIEVSRFSIARAIAFMGPTIDCRISYERVPIDRILKLNPDRVDVTPKGGYPMLRRCLEDDPAYDSIPLSMGRSRDGFMLWDGHRRLETYRAASRKEVPAWVSTFRNGSGMLKVG